MEEKEIVKGINKVISQLKDTDDISDNCHTFRELYYHRAVLFSMVCNSHKEQAWKSWKHDDGTMFDDYFIVGINTPEGSYSYHYHKDIWDMFNVKELAFAPKYDGHKPSDVTRLFSLFPDCKKIYKDKKQEFVTRQYLSCPHCGGHIRAKEIKEDYVSDNCLFYKQRKVFRCEKCQREVNIRVSSTEFWAEVF